MTDDLQRYDLDFEAADSDATRKGLTRLMYRVGEECGLNHRDKSYLIEALPGKESCLLIISVRVMKTRRRYRIRRRRCVDRCRFENADSLLDWLRLSDNENMSYVLYEKDGSYLLLAEYPLSEEQRGRLSEYGDVESIDAVAAARIREYGKELLTHSRPRHYPRYSCSAAM